MTHDTEQLVRGKQDGGVGLRSVQAVASRYDGKLIAEWDNETFTPYVLMRL